MSSVKSFIQSRGRARQNSAKFIVLMSDDQLSKAKELGRLEESMDVAVQQLMRERKVAFDEEFNNEINNFLASDHEYDNFQVEPLSAEEANISDDEEEVPVGYQAIHLVFYNFVDSDSLSQHIIRCFTSKFDKLKTTKRRITAKFVIPKTDSNAVMNIVRVRI